MSTTHSLLQILQQVPPTSFQPHVLLYALLSSVSAGLRYRVLHWSMGKILGVRPVKTTDSPSPSNHQLSIAPHVVVGTYEIPHHLSWNV